MLKTAFKYLRHLPQQKAIHFDLWMRQKAEERGKLCILLYIVIKFLKTCFYVNFALLSGRKQGEKCISILQSKKSALPEKQTYKKSRRKHRRIGFHGEIVLINYKPLGYKKFRKTQVRAFNRVVGCSKICNMRNAYLRNKINVFSCVSLKMFGLFLAN